MSGSNSLWHWKLAVSNLLMPGCVAWLFIFPMGCVWETPVPPVEPARACIDAKTVLRQAMDSEEPATRSHAIEALAQTMGAQSGPEFVQSLSDSSVGVQFAAAMAIGDTRYALGKEPLLKMAGDPTLDKNVMTAVIYALYRLGDDQYANRLGQLLFYPTDKWVRANSAMVMGRMGDRSAVGPLKSEYDDEQDPTVKIQLAEALALLQEQREAAHLEAYVNSPYLDERMIAIPALAKARPFQSRQLLTNLVDSSQQPLLVRIQAAGALAKNGIVSEDSYNLCIQTVKDPQGVLEKSQEWRNDQTPAMQAMTIRSIQSLAAMSLGQMKQSRAVDVLHPLLDNPDGAVRAAAAMSILKLLPAYASPPAAQPAQAMPPPSQKSSPARPTAPAAMLRRSGGKD